MQLEDLSYFQRQRLEYIEFRLEYFGDVCRSNLMTLFKSGPASASRDLALYKELAPSNLYLKHENKRYIRSASFQPVFNHCPTRVLDNLINGFSGSISVNSYTSNFRDRRAITITSTIHLGFVSRLINSREACSINRGDDTIQIKPVSLELLLNGSVNILASYQDSNITLDIEDFTDSYVK